MRGKLQLMTSANMTKTFTKTSARINHCDLMFISICNKFNGKKRKGKNGTARARIFSKGLASTWLSQSYN